MKYVTCHEQWNIEAHARLKVFTGKEAHPFGNEGNLGLAEAGTDPKLTQTGSCLKFKVQKHVG